MIRMFIALVLAWLVVWTQPILRDPGFLGKAAISLLVFMTVYLIVFSIKKVISYYGSGKQYAVKRKKRRV